MKQKILELLSASEIFISGEKLAELCGISRTAVWKHINSLKEEGYNIETQPRTGYKLISRPDALVKTEILDGLQTKVFGKEFLYTFFEIDSTNLKAKQLANEGKPEGTVVVAESQTKGKGRLGRKWVSPSGKGVWVSFILRPPILPVKATQLTFVIAVAMVHSLKNIGISDVQIKWPNDILIHRRKVAGILTELSAEIDCVNYVIVGIGINVNQDTFEFPEEFKDKATSLKEACGHKVSRIKVLQSVLKEVEHFYYLYLENGFGEIINLWRENSVTLGKEVEVISGTEKITGLAIDIDEEGCLLVKDREGKVNKIVAGDVSLRGKKGNYI